MLLLIATNKLYTIQYRPSYRKFRSALTVLGQNGRGQNGTNKMVRTKWYEQNGTDKMGRTKWDGQNGTDKMVPIESSINQAIQLPLTT